MALFSRPPVFDRLNLEPRVAERLKVDQPGWRCSHKTHPDNGGTQSRGSLARNFPLLHGSLVVVGCAPL